MITDQDVEKLKQTFVTKEDFDERTGTMVKEIINLFGTTNRRIDELNDNLGKRIDVLDNRIDKLDKRIVKLDNKIDDVNSNLCERIDTLDSKIGVINDNLGRKIDKINERLDRNNELILETLQELRTHRIVLGDNEKRFQRIETKLFPTP